MSKMCFFTHDSVDLLSSSDDNVRTVAAIALGHAGVKDQRIVTELCKCLKAEDRLVRAGACLALGLLKSDAGVDQLLHMW